MSRPTSRSRRSCSWAGCRGRRSACWPCRLALHVPASVRGLASPTGRWLTRGRPPSCSLGVAASVTAYALAGTAQADRGRLGHPGAARRGQRPAGPVHPGLRGHASRCACTRRSAPTWTAWRRRSARSPPRSRGCRAPRSAPGRWPRALACARQSRAASPAMPPVYEFTAGLDLVEPSGIDPAGWREGPAGIPGHGSSPARVAGGSGLGPAQQAVVNALLAEVGLVSSRRSTASGASSRGRQDGLSVERRRSPPPRGGSPRCRQRAARLAGGAPAPRCGRQITLAQIP